MPRKKILPRDRLTTQLKRKVLRSRISRAESVFSALFLVFLTGLAVALAAQRDRFDASERDIGIEVLEASQVVDDLYQTPLELWSEPGSSAKGSDLPDLGVFPVELLEGGWSLDGRVETYDVGNLYEKINGAAEQYVRFGFEQLDYATLVSGDTYLNIELYDQGSLPNTLGLYSAQRDPDRPTVRRAGAFFYPTPVGAIGAAGRFYFKISASESSALVASKADQLVDALATVADEVDSVPWSFRVLVERMRLPFDGLSFVPQDAFQIDGATDFWFATDTGTAIRYFIHEAADESAARTLYDYLVEEQGWEHRVVDSEEGSSLMEHEYLHSFFALKTRGNVVFGAFDGMDREQIEAAAQLLQEAVNDVQAS